jgi:hypothetical protein
MHQSRIKLKKVDQLSGISDYVTFRIVLSAELPKPSCVEAMLCHGTLPRLKYLHTLCATYNRALYTPCLRNLLLICISYLVDFTRLAFSRNCN